MDFVQTRLWPPLPPLSLDRCFLGRFIFSNIVWVRGIVLKKRMSLDLTLDHSPPLWTESKLVFFKFLNSSLTYDFTFRLKIPIANVHNGKLAPTNNTCLFAKNVVFRFKNWKKWSKKGFSPLQKLSPESVIFKLLPKLP